MSINVCIATPVFLRSHGTLAATRAPVDVHQAPAALFSARSLRCSDSRLFAFKSARSFMMELSSHAVIVLTCSSSSSRMFENTSYRLLRITNVDRLCEVLRKLRLARFEAQACTSSDAALLVSAKVATGLASGTSVHQQRRCSNSATQGYSFS